MDLISLLISFFVKWVILTIVFYITGRIVSGVNAKFSDAIIVAFIGSLTSFVLHEVLGYIFDFVVPTLGLPYSIQLLDLLELAIAGLITLVVYLPLFMHFFDVGFGGAVAIGILCLVIYVLIEIPIIYFEWLGWLRPYTPL